MAATFETTAVKTTNDLVTAGAVTLADRLRECSDLQPIAAHLMNLLRDAFATRDVDFPRPGCPTLKGQTFGSASAIDRHEGIRAVATQLVQGGASTPEELDCISEIALSAITDALQQDVSRAAELARLVLWLECCSQLPLLSYAATRPKSNTRERLAQGLSAVLGRNDATTPAVSRGEQWAALAWLRSAEVDLGDSGIGDLANNISPPIPIGASHWDAANSPDARILRGRLTIAPRSTLATALSAFSGWLLLRQLVEWTLRLFLGYRANAEVTLSERGLEIRESRSLLGRRLREQTTVLSMQQVKHLSREVRFARAGTYAGLAALALGSVFGMRLFVDGLRVPGFSVPLLLLGLLVVICGLGLDFVLTNWLDASKSRCRFSVIAEGGNGLCLAGVEPTRADAILSELSTRLRNAS